MSQTKQNKMEKEQPIGLTDVKWTLYERGTGKEAQVLSVGFKGIRTVDNRIISWSDLFYSKEAAISSEFLKEEAKTFTQDEVIELLVKERERAVEIAYSVKNSYDRKVKNDTNKELIYWHEQIANECRLIGNSISGINALGEALNETIKDQIMITYANQFKNK